MKQITLGILAHVDAGKTTLSEALLYKTGTIREAGRVDHGDTFLDTDSIERDRGITIFSKQARFTLPGPDGMQVTLLDTPGHVDFSAETERTLQVLDYALLLISATDGVQGHTRTLWRLLNTYHIPVFLFVNKMDLCERSREEILSELRKELDGNCVDFSSAEREGGSPGAERAGRSPGPDWLEEVAMCSEELLEQYTEEGTIGHEVIREAISHRKVYPVLFGSALKMEGVDVLLDCLSFWTKGYTELHSRAEEEPFSARVFKVGRDTQGNRLTYMKVLAGGLAVKDPVSYRTSSGERHEEKADQIRLYSGEKYESIRKAEPGTVCAVTGLGATRPGMGLGDAEGETKPVLLPVMTQAMILPPDQNPAAFYRKVKELEEEDPALHIVWDEKNGEIHAQIMGRVQIEVLTRVIKERYGASVTFGPEQILYKETIAGNVLAIGHFEPLRHYAEAQLLLMPGERGSGITVGSICREDILALNWQRLILTHVLEREHAGVLTGSPLTDVKVLIVTGRAHPKHTEGGDFRQAVYRAIRQGLMASGSVLLEPYYQFILEVPSESVGRAMTDLTARFADMGAPEITEDGSGAKLTGRAPVATMGEYVAEVHAYTQGRGHLTLLPDAYGPCHNTEEVLSASTYDPDADLKNPSASVFCAHGAGYLVPWNLVPALAHCDPSESLKAAGFSASQIKELYGSAQEEPVDSEEAERDGLHFTEDGREYQAVDAARRSREKKSGEETPEEEDQELQAIYSREFGMDRDGIRTDAENRSRRGWNRRPVSPDPLPGGNRSGNGGREDASPTGSERKYRKRSDQGESSVKKDKHGNPIYPKKDERPAYLIVDGYNIIFQWEELNALARANIDSARGKLLDILSNYQGYTGEKVTVVFDAYRTERTPSAKMRYDNLEVVFTQKDMTADAYIERLVHERIRDYKITVATSDGMEQLTVMRMGALRMSARMLAESVRAAGEYS